MNEKVFHDHIGRLRDPKRVALLDLPAVVAASIEGLIPKSFLDIGTGTALFAEAFAKTISTIAGIDTSETMIAEARRFVPAAEFKIGSAEKIPFEDGSFDIVFLGHVLHESDDPAKALAEAHRVARQRVVVLEWPCAEEPFGPPLAHRVSRKNVEKWAQEAGLQKAEVLQMHHMVMYTMDVGLK